MSTRLIQASVRDSPSHTSSVIFSCTKDTDLQVDQHAFLAFRNLQSSSTNDPKEVEANQFAATLLMPEELLLQCVLDLEGDRDLENSISKLAQQFGVSEQAMTIRLTSLHWITWDTPS